VATNELQAYTVQTNTWAQKASLPAGVNMYGGVAFALNGKGYICHGEVPQAGGGYSYSSDLWEYDPSSDSWAAKASYPGTLGYTAVSFSIGQYGYLGLGFRPYVDSFYRYDSQSDTWSPIAVYPGQARQGSSAFVINGIAYVGLGGYQNGGSFVNLPDFYKYDPGTGAWSAIAPYPDTARIDCQAFTFGGKGYIVSGMASVTADLTNRVWEYDPQNDSWRRINSFPAAFRSGMGCSNAGNTYAIVGLGADPAQNLLNHLWKTIKADDIPEESPNVTKVWFNSDAVHIRLEKSAAADYSFALYDLSGRKVMTAFLNKGENAFDLSLIQMSGGMYLYKITSSGDAAEKFEGKILVTR
jgi:N-acetylneuraminic acid mutarotase